MDYKEYKDLVDLLNKYAKAYYVLDDPIASDEEYDNLYKSLLKFEEENPSLISPFSLSKRVGGEVLDNFLKAKHLSRLWSLEDIFNKDELSKWLNKKDKKDLDISFYIEPKFDGATLNLIYEKGFLQKAITRGDGFIGEDVTQNAKTIKSIPLKIDYEELIEIRGEVVIYTKDFLKINEEKEKQNENLFKNPRNIVAGSLRQLDSKVTAKRNLVFIPHGIGFNNIEYDLLNLKMEFLYKLGFKKVPYSKVCKDIEEIQKNYEYILSNRVNFSMALDGVVVKINEIQEQDNLGYTVKNPKWAFAYKFPALEKVTRLKDIILQVGRTGSITPVAILDPIEIEGVIIERATLHNFDEIQRKDVRINDKLIVLRSGDVIPKVTKVLKDRRDGSEKVFLKPTNCPSCNSLLLDEGAILKCQNLSCDARIVNNIIHFASRSCLNIEGLGVQIVKTLYDNGLIKTPKDLFFLDKYKLLKLDGFKEKKVLNLINSIENVKGVNLDKFINSLGIDNVGEVASRLLADNFALDFYNCSKEGLLSIDGFGKEIADSLINFFSINKDLIRDLIDIIKPSFFKKELKINNIFTNKSIVITGVFTKSRSEIKDILNNMGAKFSSSISKKTDYLLCGENAGSKYEKAISLGVDIIDEKELESILNDN